jgi:RHS repeat-associated protein
MVMTGTRLCSPAQRPKSIFEFTGKERDQETGLDYFGARYLSAAQGRFMTSDPGPFIIADPQSWNRYSYVQNNPLKFTDPTGRVLDLSGDAKDELLDYLMSKSRNRASDVEWSGSGIVNDSVSAKTEVASSKETACFLRFESALR